MKKHFIKIISVIIITVILVSALTVIPSAASGLNVLVLGDSISTGFGLDGALYERPSYANLINKAINFESLLNLAVDGATSTDLLISLNGITDKIEDADVIIMSIGGNDMLRTTGAVLAEALEITEETDLAHLLGAVSNLPAEEVGALFASEAVIAKYGEMVSLLAQNLNAILTTINVVNPYAQIIILDQYNPFSGIESSEAMIAFDIASENLIGWMNGVIIGSAFDMGADVCDAYTAFAGQGSLYTRILEMDIHPNEAGHALLADILLKIIEIEDPVPETSDKTPWYILGIVLSGAGSAFFMKNRRKVSA